MGAFVPAGNVQAAALAGATTTILVHLLTANGVVVPADVADSIAVVMTVLVAHLCDVYQSNIKPPEPPK